MILCTIYTTSVATVAGLITFYAHAGTDGWVTPNKVLKLLEKEYSLKALVLTFKMTKKFCLPCLIAPFESMLRKG